MKYLISALLLLSVSFVACEKKAAAPTENTATEDTAAPSEPGHDHTGHSHGEGEGH